MIRRSGCYYYREVSGSSLTVSTAGVTVVNALLRVRVISSLCSSQFTQLNVQETVQED